MLVLVAAVAVSAGFLFSQWWSWCFGGCFCCTPLCYGVECLVATVVPAAVIFLLEDVVVVIVLVGRCLR